MADEEAQWPLQQVRRRPRRPSDNTFRRQGCTVLLAVVSVICMTLTVLLAYNSSLEQPFMSNLHFHKPQRTVLVLNIATQVTIFSLSELTFSILDSIRWAFACSKTGVSAVTFLSLSRATNIAGVIYLILGAGAAPIRFRRDGHRVWGLQRYASKDLGLLKIVLPVTEIGPWCSSAFRYLVRINISQGF